MLFGMVDEIILFSNSMLRYSVIYVTKDASNITQFNIQVMTANRSAVQHGPVAYLGIIFREEGLNKFS
jgi:hypothetical protein